MRLHTEIPFSELQLIIGEIVSSLDRNQLRERRWFRKKNDEITGLELFDYTSLAAAEPGILVIPSIIVFKLLDRAGGRSYRELYYLPLLISKIEGEQEDVLLEIHHRDYQAAVTDGVHSPVYNRALYGLTAGTGQLLLKKGRIQAQPLPGLQPGEVESSQPLTEVSSNSLTLLANGLIIKTYRRLKQGVNPDLELSLNLLQETTFRSFPRPRGFVYYNSAEGERYYLCLLEDYAPNLGDVWSFSRNHLQGCLDQVQGPGNGAGDYAYAEEEAAQPGDGAGLNRAFSEEMARVGRVIGELHLALAGIDKPDFRPVDPLPAELEKWHQGVSANARLVFRRIGLEKNDRLAPLLEEIYSRKEAVYQALNGIFALRHDLGKVFRIHGDLHLEQVIRTESGYLILDFEGEPLKSLKERRLKQSPLKDLAGMIRSYNYAAHTALVDFGRESGESRAAAGQFQQRVRTWEAAAITAFLKGYLDRVRRERPELLPPAEHFKQVLALFKLEKALYEVIYEINNRPGWLPIPLQGIKDCLGDLKDLDQVKEGL